MNKNIIVKKMFLTLAVIPVGLFTFLTMVVISGLKNLAKIKKDGKSHNPQMWE